MKVRSSTIRVFAAIFTLRSARLVLMTGLCLCATSFLTLTTALYAEVTEHPANAHPGDLNTRSGSSAHQNGHSAANNQFGTPQASEADLIRRVGQRVNHQQFEDAIALANDPRLRHATRSSLLGYIALRAGAPKRARQYFVEVLRADPDRALIWTYLAMAHYRLGDLERADKALERVTTPEGKTPEYWALRARLAREQDSAPQAFELLLGALKQFNQSAQLLREAAYVLLAHSAVYAARPFAEAFLWRSPPSQSWRETARWIETLIQLEHLGEAIAQLEIARWRFPEHASEILGRQAYLYASRGWASTAARLFAQASSRDPGSFAFEAADQFRISQKTNDALIWNIHVKKTAQRLPQRLLILIEDERWARAAALAPQLAKAGLMGDTTRYQLGVAFLHSGDLARAQEQAQRIADQQFKTRLLELIASCEAQIAAGGGLWCW